MGVSCMGLSSSTFDYMCGKENDKNPDPYVYIIESEYVTDNGCVLFIHYPNCTNYEGRKILVFDAQFDVIKKQIAIDPHFSNNKEFISPIARFVPTIEGWDMAKFLLDNLGCQK